MKYYFVFFVLLSGCAIFNQFDEIVQKPVREWSREDCLTVLMSAVSHNLYREDTRIRIIVTPFSPLVITAFSRLEQYKKQSPNEQFSKVLEERLLEDVGLYFDTKSGRTFDSKGNFYHNVTQADSFMVMVNLMNKTWPCAPPMGIAKTSHGYKVVPLVGGHLNDDPCHTPDISDLETRIFLENDFHELLKPRFVYGRKQNIFFKEESLLILFPLRQEGHHFLEQSKHVYLRVNGIDGDMKIEIPLETFLNYPVSQSLN